MQCKAIQMSSSNTWSPQSWSPLAQPRPAPSQTSSQPLPPAARVQVGGGLEGVLSSELWTYYRGGDVVVSTGRYVSDSVSSDEGSPATDDTDDNNNNTTTNRNVPTPPSPDNNNNNNNSDNNNSSDSNDNSKSKDKGRARLVDGDGFIRRAACLCVDDTMSKVLLVSSKDRCSWLVPGGGVEAGEDVATAAVREAWEEAGVRGLVTGYLGMFETTHHSGCKKHRTAVFVVMVKQVHKQYPEAHLGRARQWFSLEDALVQLTNDRPVQSAYLQLLLLSRLHARQD